MPLPSRLGSAVDGHALQIDELKGSKPTEKINLSRKGLDVASAIIIASCIKGNGVLKELKCAAAPYSVFAFVSAPADVRADTTALCNRSPSCPFARSLSGNGLSDQAKQVVKDASRSGVTIHF